ncbi:uncharacterized protein LOC110843137 [Folsomia candida]|uniref:Uncharacterized protein n=1 Tax=Folsomia candida TaxID=158441 RepID=A0A226EUG7_FOLCA|nr:uncharacterized protein LOC110843137 [Folsomia candida]OXA60797.1 hypothetical protein Fcan01_04372 [Folsomia candida]
MTSLVPTIFLIFSGARFGLGQISTLLVVPPFDVPPPPLHTNCHTFEIYLNDTTISSLNREDFLVLRQTAVILPTQNCTGNNNSTDNKAICAETRVKVNPVMSYANYRASVIVCRKWWGEKTQGLLDSPTPKDLDTLCIVFPTRPWCDPKTVCGWYPKLAMCIKGNFNLSSTTSSSEHVWFIAGILKNSNYTLSNCDKRLDVLLSNDSFDRLKIGSIKKMSNRRN